MTLAADLDEEGIEVDVEDAGRHEYLRPHPPLLDGTDDEPDVQDAFNEQMKQEFYSSYLYLSMSAYCEARISRAWPAGCGSRRGRRSSMR